MKDYISSLYKEIKNTLNKHNESTTLPSGCFYLSNGNILATPNKDGEARYPYTFDGFTLWAYSSGYLSVNESNFFIFPPEKEGKEPYVSFYGGIKVKDIYKVFSLSGSADSEFGRENEQYVVYNRHYFIYLRKINNVLFSIKGTVNKEKKILFSLRATNLSKSKKEIFLSSYFNPLLTHSAAENEETRWFRTCYLKEDGAFFHSVEDMSRDIHLNSYLRIKRATNSKDIDVITSRKDYIGNKNHSISQSSCLRKGSFDVHKPVSTFIDMAAYGDIVKKELNAKEELLCNYQIYLTDGNDDTKEYHLEDNEKLYEKVINNKDITIEFKEFNNKEINNNLFNKFTASVIKQVDYCSKAKNSSLKLLGIRDLYQMLEASLIWNKDIAKERIIDSLNYITLNGRTMRQYSSFTKEGTALVDSREFIDQGQWIISTIYQYLAFTNDYSLLNEKCGYIELISPNLARLLDKRETVYEHLKRIINYLISNIDEKTNCLKTLYGDWNDAVDGLGISYKGKEFSNGVSIMASEHLYKNLKEMSDIASIKNETNNYLEIRDRLAKGIKEYGIINNRIVHGWGEDQSFYVGSQKDVDGKDRNSITSNAFFVISGLINQYPEMEPHILKAYQSLDSKYGYKTFDQYFDKKDASKVGRIVNLPKGTAENAATYIHGALFAVRSLLIMNEGKEAFKQILKLIPITHNKISVSPFVMPNSYGYNPELGIDGESMSDWYTGSSNTFLKAIIFDMFGINPEIGNAVKIKPIKDFPCKNASIQLNIKNKRFIINYSNLDKKSRTIRVNGYLINSNTINVKDYPKTIRVEIVD